MSDHASRHTSTASRWRAGGHFSDVLYMCLTFGSAMAGNIYIRFKCRIKAMVCRLLIAVCIFIVAAAKGPIILGIMLILVMMRLSHCVTHVRHHSTGKGLSVTEERTWNILTCWSGGHTIGPCRVFYMASLDLLRRTQRQFLKNLSNTATFKTNDCRNAG